MCTFVVHVDIYCSNFLLPTEKIVGMNHYAYPYAISRDHSIYTFDSYGPNGKITKIVQYISRDAAGITFFNLGFGDLDPETGKIDDLAVSNNLDKARVLATVAATVVDVTSKLPDAIIYVRGSTPSRTRLYQMGVSANWEQISALLHVYGFAPSDGWQSYQKNINYEAFLARRK